MSATDKTIGKKKEIAVVVIKVSENMYLGEVRACNLRAVKDFPLRAGRAVTARDLVGQSQDVDWFLPSNI